MARPNRVLYIIWAVLIAAGIYVVCLLSCASSENAGQMCLSWATPHLKQLERYSRWIDRRETFTEEFTWIGYGLAALVVISIARRRFRLGLFWLLASIAFAAEWAALLSRESIALLLHGTALISLTLFWLASRSFGDERETQDPEFRWWEIGALILLFVPFMFMRWYALNRIPEGWDTEMCIFRYITSSWQGIWGHELGYSPTTSHGFIWLLLNHFMGNYDEPVTYFLEQRYVGVAISALKLVVFFFFLRACIGRFAAYFGCVLLAFGPPEDWWARQIGYHHLPALIAIGVLWSTWAALRKPSWRNFLAATVFSALCRFIYPSGMFMAFVPCTVFFVLLVIRWSEWRPHIAKILVLLVGVGFWLGWAALVNGLYLGEWYLKPPFAVPANYALPVSFAEKLYRIFVVNGSELITGLFLHQVDPAHWTFSLTSVPGRSVTSAAIILSILGIARMLSRPRDPVTVLLLVALWWSAVPGLATSVADRRLAVIFVVMIVIAAREGSFLLGLLRQTIGRYLTPVVAFVVPFVIGGNLAWIGANRFFMMTPGVPRQVAIGQVFRDEIKNDTLVVDLIGQLQCDWFSAVYRKLKEMNCQAGFVSSQYQNGLSIADLVERPRTDPQYWTTTYTDMAKCVNWKDRQWPKVTYVLTNSDRTQQLLQQLQSRHPGGVTEERTVQLSVFNKEKVMIYRVDMQRPTSSQTPN